MFSIFFSYFGNSEKKKLSDFYKVEVLDSLCLKEIYGSDAAVDVYNIGANEDVSMESSADSSGIDESLYI